MKYMEYISRILRDVLVPAAAGGESTGGDTDDDESNEKKQVEVSASPLP